MTHTSPTAQGPPTSCEGVRIEMTCCYGENWYRQQKCMPIQDWTFFQQCWDSLVAPICIGGTNWLLVDYGSCAECDGSDSNLGFIRKVGNCTFDCASHPYTDCILTNCFVIVCQPQSLPCDEW